MKLRVFFIFFILLSCGKNGFAEKVWPQYPLRGINTTLVANEKGNTQNPGGYLSDEMFAKLSEWNINVIRVFINVDRYSIWDIDADAQEIMPPVPADNPIEPYTKHLEGLETALELAKKHRIYVIPVVNNVLNRKSGVLYNICDDLGYQKNLIELWQHIAREFGTNPWLLAYDLLNEPHTENETRYWQQLTLPTLVNEIRAIDTDTYFIVEPGPWGGTSGFKTLTPVNDSKVVYSFHFYAPHSYTHQGIKQNQDTKGQIVYPGKLKAFPTSAEIMWDRDELLKYPSIAVTFQQKYNVRILIGEFGVIRWAPGAAKWIEETLSVFDKHDFDWCFHSYGGWNGWNPTFSGDMQSNNNIDGGKVTDRLKILLKAWNQNKKN